LVTEPEAQNLVCFFAARCEDEHRNVRSTLAKRPQHAISVHAGKHEIEHDQVGCPTARALEAGFSVLCYRHLIAFNLESGTQTVGEVGIVFDDEYSRHDEWKGLRRRVAIVYER